ncbi:plasmid recombination protein [Phaeobacter gallaeciensis]|nr:plasmid recombination protein [Phaeobacter gallaeciensis]MDE4355475.1 plasmid recombination protein [Phaeobacter gallaeciensis]MDE4368884.1 plasmid recombination protein [Phaeobacter gallaeciensis]MDE4386740.1 plasmid recombination protein [Phaeobacter gallaeciensis]MDE4399888.1 plasmid recombination protein [Phaeobacter gallaeciensis]
MTVQPQFTQAQPVNLKKPPIVLRFSGLWPHTLRRFRFHDERRGGDLGHVDLGRTTANEILVGDENWDQVIRDEIAQMKQHNFEQHLEALQEKSRKSEARRVEEAGPVNPWRASKEGPLREGILTVNKDWFGGSGQAQWDPERVEEFKRTALEFLRRSFPDGQLRYASMHMDEEALHIHFVVAVWVEKTSANRGHQILLQPSENPLLKNYERAQDMAGAAFAKIGITRGERRAEARRQARAEGKPLPAKKEHVAPSQWRAEERRRAQKEKKRILYAAEATAKVAVEDGRDLAKATVKKSRKRAIKEAQARKRRAAKETAEATRRRDAAEEKAQQFEKAAAAASSTKKRIEAEIGSLKPIVQGYEERAEAAAEKFRQKRDARKLEEENTARISREKEDMEGALPALQQREADLHEQVQSLAQHRANEEAAGMAAQSARRIEEKKLAEAAKRVQLKVAEAEAISEAMEVGLELVADGALVWQDAMPGSKPKLSWGPSAPVDEHGRAEKLKEIRPARRLVARIARLVAQTVKRVLAKERQKLQDDAEYVRGLREQWEPEAQARLAQISRDPDGGRL